MIPSSSMICHGDYRHGGETIEVLTMSEGEVSHFFIAPDLAYGHLDRTSRHGR